METNHTIDDGIESLGHALTDDMKKHWTETRKWGLFFAVLGLIFTLFAIIAAAALTMQRSTIDNTPNMPFSSFGLAAFYVIVGIFYAIPVYYLFMFNNRAKMAVSQDSMEHFEESLSYMKLLFRSVGLLTISLFVLYGVFILVFIQNSTAF